MNDYAVVVGTEQRDWILQLLVQGGLRRATAARGATVISAWNRLLRAAGAAILQEQPDAKQAVGTERRDAIFRWSAA